MKHTVTEHKLSGGTKGLAVHVPGADVFRIVIRFNSGYQFGNHARFEVPHVLEHLMGCGSKKYPGANEFNIQVERNGAMHNAMTGSRVNGYYVECADFERGRILDLFDEYIAHPLIPVAAVPTEIANVREELTRSTTQPSRVCSINLLEATFPKEYMNYDRRIAQLPDITREHIDAYRLRTHTQANARFYIAGDLPDGGAEVVARLERTFAKLPIGERLTPYEAPGLNLVKPVIGQRDIKTVYYEAMAYGGGFSRERRDSMVLLRLLLGGGFGSRIFGEARRLGIAYDLSVHAHATTTDSEFGFSGHVLPEHAEALFGLYGREVTRLLEGDLSDADLKAPIELGIGSTQRSVQTVADILGWYIGPYDSEEIILDYSQYLDHLRTITARDAISVLRETLSFGHRGASFLGDIDTAYSQALSTQAQVALPILHNKH